MPRGWLERGRGWKRATATPARPLRHPSGERELAALRPWSGTRWPPGALPTVGLGRCSEIAVASQLAFRAGKAWVDLDSLPAAKHSKFFG